MSTRRFWALPSGVSLLDFGALSADPPTENRSGGNDELLSINRITEMLRAIDSSQLLRKRLLRMGKESVWPSSRMWFL